MASTWALSWGSSWGGSWGPLPIARRGGRFIFDREPELPEQLEELIEPEPRPTAQVQRQPARTRKFRRADIPKAKLPRVDKLLADTGISMNELLFIVDSAIPGPNTPQIAPDRPRRTIDA